MQAGFKPLSDSEKISAGDAVQTVSPALFSAPKAIKNAAESKSAAYFICQ